MQLTRALLLLLCLCAGQVEAKIENVILRRNVIKSIFEHQSRPGGIGALKIVAIARANFSEEKLLVSPTVPEGTDPVWLKGRAVRVPQQSALSLLLNKCAASANLQIPDIKPVLSTVSDSVASLRSQKIDGIGIWSPFTHAARGRATEPQMTYTQMCDAEDLKLPAFSVALVDLSRASPHEVAANVAAEFASIGKMRKTPGKSLSDIKRAYGERDLPISDADAVKELMKGLPPSFKTQLAMFDNSKGPSLFEATLSKLIDDLASEGIILTKPKPSDLLDGSVLREIANDPKLRKLATSND